MKKLQSLYIVLALCLSIFCTAFAEGTIATAGGYTGTYWNI